MSDQSRPSQGRRYVFLALKITVSIILLSILFWKVDVAEVWAKARHASPLWLFAALALYGLNVLVSTWRWHLLLEAQHVEIPLRRLLGSFVVATFFNNFLPSNIGGDVVRIGDTAGPAGSKTLATMIVFMDRGLGLMGLVLVAALGATMASPGASPVPSYWLWAALAAGATGAGPAILAPEWFARLLKPLTLLHREWVTARIETLENTLAKFRDAFGAILATLGGAIVVQGMMVVFYGAVARALGIPIGLWDLAVVVPVSFVVQMVPVSLGGFGIREATFTLYFKRIGLGADYAIALSLIGQVLQMLFSLSGAAVYISRGSKK
jgi:glycosyltransferase 2 family protein